MMISCTNFFVEKLLQPRCVRSSTEIVNYGVKWVINVKLIGQKRIIIAIQALPLLICIFISPFPGYSGSSKSIAYMQTLKFVSPDQKQHLFADAVRKNVNDYFKEKGISTKGNL